MKKKNLHVGQRLGMGKARINFPGLTPGSMLLSKEKKKQAVTNTSEEEYQWATIQPKEYLDFFFFIPHFKRLSEKPELQIFIVFFLIEPRGSIFIFGKFLAITPGFY